jgi:hypothetical protein
MLTAAFAVALAGSGCRVTVVPAVIILMLFEMQGML